MAPKNPKNPPSAHTPFEDQADDYEQAPPKAVLISADHRVMMITPGTQAKSASADEVFDAINADLKAGYGDRSQQERWERGIDNFVSMLRTRDVVPYGMASQGHPNNYDTKLDPAAQLLLKRIDQVHLQAPAVLVGISMERFKEDHVRVIQLKGAQETFAQLAQDLDAARTGPERRLDGTLRTVGTRLKPLKQPLAELCHQLDPLFDYSSGDAETGAQTRKDLDKARLEAVRAAAQAAAKAPPLPQPAAPAPTPAPAPAPAYAPAAPTVTAPDTTAGRGGRRTPRG